tara:strand:- start:3261 stop:3737 length:477 start_codon:yes stop_codon:yes gene_type:complete
MANRGPLASVLIVDPVFTGRSANAGGNGAAALAPLAFGDGAGTDAGTISAGATLTVAQLLSGFYTANGGGSSRILTLPSFALLSDATSGVCKGIGDRFEFTIYNKGATHNLVVTGVANVTVIVGDATDATIPPAHLATVTLVRISSTAIVAAVNLFGP